MVEPPPTRKFKSLLPLALAIKNSKNKNSRKIVKRENKGNKIFCLVIVNSSTLEYGNVINVTLGGSRHRELKFASDRSALKMDLDSARSHSSKRLQRSAASGKHESIHNRAPSLLSSHCWDSHVLFLVTLFLYLFFGASSARAQALTQGSTLKALAREWNANFSDWGRIEDPCLGNWSGVTCDNATMSQVLVLNLKAKGLKGPIPREIGELVYLRELYLDDNFIRDPIPVEIGKLTALQILSINRNNLTSLPPDALLACNLSQLSLDQNVMSGQLPPWIGQLSNLKRLNMSSNALWGGLPPEWGNLKNLKSMEIWENQLSGFIPDEWRHLTSLERWAIGHMYITGSLPKWIFELPALKYVGFFRNQFVGPYPNISELLYNGISNITTLRLGCNFLQGDFPTSYYKVVPSRNITIQAYSNCYNNETDTVRDSHSTNTNATQNTPQNCSRIWDCSSFYAQVAKNPDQCAPCPPSQVFTDSKKCICGPTDAQSANFSVGRTVGGIVGGVCGLVAIGILVFVLHRRKKRIKYPEFGRMYTGIKEPWAIPKGLRRLTLHELEIATNYFNETHYLGKGSFGSVYYGILDDENRVAIKCASVHNTQGQQQFRNELTLLSRLHHRHLVALKGFCDEDGLQILIYEYIENGDLHENLFGKNGRIPLNSHQRIHIALGITRGLQYLHTSANPPVIHRDIKPSNVLLDICMVPKLVDFGISKVSLEFDTHVSTQPQGTMGYLDPDYMRTNQLTTASDIYALGVVLLEIISGQRVVDYTRLEAFNLVEWVKPRFKEGRIKEIVDKNLGDDFNEELYAKIVEVAIQCTSIDKMDRPSIQDVLQVLEPYGDLLYKVQSYETMWSRSYFKNASLFED